VAKRSRLFIVSSILLSIMAFGLFWFPASLPAAERSPERAAAAQMAHKEMTDWEMSLVSAGEHLRFGAAESRDAGGRETGRLQPDPAGADKCGLQVLTDDGMGAVTAGRRPVDVFMLFEPSEYLQDTVVLTQDLTIKTYRLGCRIDSQLPWEAIPSLWKEDPDVTEAFLMRYRLMDVSMVDRGYYEAYKELHGWEMEYLTPTERYARYYEENPITGVDGKPLKVDRVNFIAKMTPAETEFTVVDKPHFGGTLLKKSGCVYQSGNYIIFKY